MQTGQLCLLSHGKGLGRTMHMAYQVGIARSSASLLNCVHSGTFLAVRCGMHSRNQMEVSGILGLSSQTPKSHDSTPSTSSLLSFFLGGQASLSNCYRQAWMQESSVLEGVNKQRFFALYMSSGCWVNLVLEAN